MSNSPCKVEGKYGKFQELVDSDEQFLIDLIASPPKALCANGFSDNNDTYRVRLRQARNEVLQFAKKKFREVQC